MNVLVIGANGMIGNTVFKVLSENKNWNVFGSIRNEKFKQFFQPQIQENLIITSGLEYQDSLIKLFNQVRPDVVINCAGLTKHKIGAEDPLVSIPINTLMPHHLAGLCKLVAARLIHISTDCVFDGSKEGYVESDFPDAKDVYGKSKALGEIDYPNSITLRTSTIGHELESQFGLLDWFLSQNGTCKGYSNAIFSGLPTVVFAQIIRDTVIPNKTLTGLYHVAAAPINKYELLNMIADVYRKKIIVTADTNLIINRSLDATRFQSVTGYVAPEWRELIKVMHEFFIKGSQ